MNILVIGCDQVGAALVRDLERIGHDISLIEKDPEQLKRCLLYTSQTKQNPSPSATASADSHKNDHRRPE